MTPARIKIIVPDRDLRMSLEFALEAAGYDVNSTADLADAIGPVPNDCYILDHQAAQGPRGDVSVFCRRAQPLIVLAGRPTPWLSEQAFCTIQKPLLGEALLDAIGEALAVSGAAGPP